MLFKIKLPCCIQSVEVIIFRKGFIQPALIPDSPNLIGIIQELYSEFKFQRETPAEDADLAPMLQDNVGTSQDAL